VSIQGGMAKPKKGKLKDPATEAARQLFLYGSGDGVRILEISELSKATGASIHTIRNWMPEWLLEMEDSLKSTSKLASPTSLSVPDEVLEDHKSDLAFFRANLDILKKEHDSLDMVLDQMYQFSSDVVRDEDKLDQFIAIFDRYCRMCMNRKNLMSQIVKIKELWDSKIGVDSLKNIQEATAKAVSVANAKSEPSPTQDVKENVVNGGVFRKRLD
jgi:hypothetical protein